MNDSVWKIGMPVLAIWVLGLTLHALSADRGPSAEGAPVVAFVHGDSLQRGMHLMKNLQANLMAQIEARETQLQEDAQPLQSEAQELLAYANSDQATEDEMEIAQGRILEIERALGQMQRAAESQVVQAEQSMQAVIAEALKRELETYAQEEGIDMILNWGLSGEGVLYGGTLWDVTEDVLDRLNQSHPLMVPDTTTTP